jgi:hypothetical protein
MIDSKVIDTKVRCFNARKFFYSGLLFAVLLAAAIPAASQGDRKIEKIDASATGTGTQLGKRVTVQVSIYQYSTAQDTQVLIDAFKRGLSEGLVKALIKMKPVGRIAITGTVGYDLDYISLIQTPTGRSIRFAADRPIGIGEAYNGTPSMAYNLLAGQIDLNDSDKSKSAGVLYPACQLIINKEGQLQFELRKNPWKLLNIIDWNGAGSKE